MDLVVSGHEDSQTPAVRRKHGRPRGQHSRLQPQEKPSFGAAAQVQGTQRQSVFGKRRRAPGLAVPRPAPFQGDPGGSAPRRIAQLRRGKDRRQMRLSIAGGLHSACRRRTDRRQPQVYTGRCRLDGFEAQAQANDRAGRDHGNQHAADCVVAPTRGQQQRAIHRQAEDHQRYQTRAQRLGAPMEQAAQPKHQRQKRGRNAQEAQRPQIIRAIPADVWHQPRGAHRRHESDRKKKKAPLPRVQQRETSRDHRRVPQSQRPGHESRAPALRRGAARPQPQR